MSGNFLFLLLGPNEHRGYRVIRGAIPEDAKILKFHHDFYTDTVLVLLESKEFDVVPDDQPIPEIEPVVEVLPEVREVVKLTW